MDDKILDLLREFVEGDIEWDSGRTVEGGVKHVKQTYEKLRKPRQVYLSNYMSSVSFEKKILECWGALEKQTTQKTRTSLLPR